MLPNSVFQIPDDLEVGYVPLSLGGAYPGLYLFTSPARFVRPVKNLSIPPTEEKNTELIGPFEQVSLALYSIFSFTLPFFVCFVTMKNLFFYVAC